MAASTSLRYGRNVNRSPSTRLVNVFCSKQFGKKFRLSSLNMKEFVRWVVEARSAFSQHCVALLKPKSESGKLQKFAIIFAATDELFCAKRGRAGPRSFEGVHGSEHLYSQ